MGTSALEGVRVIENAIVWAGPWVGTVLADMGAEVIRVESRRRLDIERRVPPFAGGKPGPNRGGFNLINPHKKSCTLDLTQPKAVALFKELVKISDVVFENFPRE